MNPLRSLALIFITVAVLLLIAISIAMAIDDRPSEPEISEGASRLIQSPTPRPAIFTTRTPTPNPVVKTTKVAPEVTPAPTAVEASGELIPTTTPQRTFHPAIIWLDAQELELLELVQTYRAENGLGGLTLLVELTDAAEWMADDIAQRGFLSHIDSQGRDIKSRQAVFGWSDELGGEVLARGWMSAADVLRAWQESPTHNEALLNPKFTHIGVARAELKYWAVELGGLS